VQARKLAAALKGNAALPRTDSSSKAGIADWPAYHEGLPGARRWYAVCSLTLGTIVTTVGGSIINIALPVLAREFHVTSGATVLVVTVYQLVLMMTLLPLSALGDRFGHRVVYQSGLVVFVLATLLSFFANSLSMLVLVRAIQAAGAAGVTSVSSALIREIYPARQLGRGLGFNTVMAASFAALAPSVGGAILAVAHWPWMFATLVPFGVVSIVFGRNALPDPIIHQASFDMRGALLCALTFGLVVIGLESGMHGDRPALSWAMLVIGLGVGFAFSRRELRQERPMLPVDLLRHSAIALPTLGMFTAYVAWMIVTVNLPFRLQQGFHLSPAGAGAVLAIWPLASMVVAPTAGMLSDRYPAAALGTIGMLVAIVGLVALAFLPGMPTRMDFAWRIVLCASGFSLFMSPNARQIIGAAPRSRMAAAGALATTTRGAAQTLGATVAGAVLAMGLGNGRTSCALSTALAALAALCSLMALRAGRFETA
jgi:DHA2 family multidrug resistance protein-like MFS transporter